MKTRILFLLFLFIISPIMAQSSKLKVIYEEKPIGVNNKFQKEIIANEYIFPRRIHEIYVDTISGYATTQLRKLSRNGKILSDSGIILVYDIEKNDVKWSQKIDFSKSYLNQYNQLIMQSKGNKLISLNIENGNKLWECKNDFYYVNQKKGIAIGYKNSGLAGSNHLLEGISLKNGNTIWKRELKREYGWNKKIQLNDSTLLVASAGLHTINIFNGSGWDYETITGKKDYSETIAKNTAGIVLGVLTGTYVTSSGPNVVSDVVSNIIIDSANFYIASKEKISQVDRQSGKINWSTNLPEDLTSKSNIFKNDSTLYLINSGFAYWGRKKIDFGQPFIMGLNINTGNELIFSTISDKKDFLLDFKVDNITVSMIFKDRMVIHSLKDGSILKSNTFNADKLGDLKFFVSSSIYIKNKDLFFENLVLSDSSKYCIQTNKGKTLVLDSELNIINQLEFNQLYFNYGNYKDLVFLGNDDETIVLDKNNEEIANLKVSFDSLILGGKLYYFNNEKLVVVDLTNITEQKKELQ